MFSARRCGVMNETRFPGRAFATYAKNRGTKGDEGDNQCSCWLRCPQSYSSEGDKRGQFFRSGCQHGYLSPNVPRRKKRAKPLFMRLSPLSPHVPLRIRLYCA